ncbi:GRAM domain-containing protein 2B-like [Chironomus tepperi]|uniref:GRAM domain-containing protein 2B-like n=1 Tax=Chironomus tepperi TaxID=113505 RepID=UPI00391F9D86
MSGRDYLLHPPLSPTRIVKIGKNGSGSEPKSEKKEKKIKKVEMSESRIKKFRKLFAQKIGDDEKLINYFSCALVADILLQGHLYVSENYFSFYSNVFGYVTKLVIPISSVSLISKEKTAKMFPNAIGIQLSDAKHVFGSFLSRETAYQLMLGMTKVAQVPALESNESINEIVEDEPDGHGIDVEVTDTSKEDSSSLSSEGTTQFKITETVEMIKQDVEDVQEQPEPPSPPPPTPKVQKVQQIEFKSMPKVDESSNHSMVLFIGIALTLLLAFFTAFLLIRINSLENRHLTTRDYSKMTIEEAEQILNRNLMTVRNVRQKLEELSSHLETKFREQSRDEL